jgi:hypothetical protein
MKSFIRFAAKLYPRAWRERYGAEFEALLDDTGTDARIAFNVLVEAIGMRVQSWKRIAPAVLLGTAALSLATCWAGQKPYTSPGTQLIFHQDSTLGGMIGLLVFLAAAVGGLISSMLKQDGKFHAAKRARRASFGIVIVYLAAILLVSLFTPRLIVNIGDRYCYDTWCISVQRVNATLEGQKILYTAEVRIFSDANSVPASRAKDFLYARDEHGRRFPLVQEPSLIPADVTVNPGQSVNTSLTFLAPANARNLYLASGYAVMPWCHCILVATLLHFTGAPSCGFAEPVSGHYTEGIITGSCVTLM